MDRQLLDTAIRNVAARKGQSYCLYLNNKNVLGYFDDEKNAFVLDYESMHEEFDEEVKLLEIELAELQYDKHQQDKIDIGEPNVNNENEVL